MQQDPKPLNSLHQGSNPIENEMLLYEQNRIRREQNEMPSVAQGALLYLDAQAIDVALHAMEDPRKKEENVDGCIRTKIIPA